MTKKATKRKKLQNSQYFGLLERILACQPGGQNRCSWQMQAEPLDSISVTVFADISLSEKILTVRSKSKYQLMVRGSGLSKNHSDYRIWALEQKKKNLGTFGCSSFVANNSKSIEIFGSRLTDGSRWISWCCQYWITMCYKCHVSKVSCVTWVNIGSPYVRRVMCHKCQYWITMCHKCHVSQVSCVKSVICHMSQYWITLWIEGWGGTIWASDYDVTHLSSSNNRASNTFYKLAFFQNRFKDLILCFKNSPLQFKESLSKIQLNILHFTILQ